MKKTLFYLLILIILFQPINSVLSTHGEVIKQESSPKDSILAIVNNDSLLNQTNLGSYLTVDVTGYSSSPEETDDNPFITASGKYVRQGIVAANFLPIGTKIRFPERFGNQIFVVEDRMNKRFYDKVDIWFETKEEAKNFGVQSLKIEIL